METINSTANTLITGTAGDDSIKNEKLILGTTVPFNVTIDASDGNDTISNDGNYVSIISGNGDDSIFNNDPAANGYGASLYENARGANVTIIAGSGADTVGNKGIGVIIDGGDGNDNIRNSKSGTTTTISGGAGDDEINNHASYVVIDGGTGNDSIRTYRYSNLDTTPVNVTISGGQGNDSISIGKPTRSSIVGEPDSGIATGMVVYNEGDGHDSVWGYGDTDSLQINSSVGWSSVVSGNNIVITVGDGSITLVDAATSSGVNINGVTYPIDTDNTDTDNNVTDNTDTDNNVTDNTVTDNTVTDNITPDTLPPAVGGAAYDIVFFVDVSGSMETYINRVNAIAQTFVDKLKERGITDYRLAVVDYETAFNVYFGADGSPFTQDVDTFKSWMAQAAEKSKSNLANENALYAINHVLNNFPFNPTANKEFIVLTDENFTDDGYPENFGGNIFDLAATEQFMAANDVQLDVIGRVDGSCDSAWTPVARNTGGNFYDINGNYTETFNEIVLNLDCVNVNLATVPDGQTGWFFVVPGNHVTDMKSVDAVFVNAADPNLVAAYTQLYGQPVGAVTADKVYSGDMSAYRQNITIPDMWNVTATSHADILNVAGTGFGVVIASGDGHDAVKLGDAATGIILTDHSLDDDGLEFARRQTLGTFTENVATDPVTMTNQVALTSPTMAVYLQNFSSPLQEEFDAKNEQFMAYGVTNGGTTNTVYDLLFGTEPTPEPPVDPVEPVIPPQPPIANDTLEGRIMFAQWGYGFTPTKDNPLYGATTAATTDTTSAITTETLATSADLAENFGSPTLDEISPANFAVTQDNFAAQSFTADFANMQAYKLSATGKAKFC